MSGPTNYQWVITSTNYDGTAAPKYLLFDGIDDALLYDSPYALRLNPSTHILAATPVKQISTNRGFFTINPTSTTNYTQRSLCVDTATSIKADCRNAPAAILQTGTLAGVPSVFSATFGGVKKAAVAVGGGDYTSYTGAAVPNTTATNSVIGYGLTNSPLGFNLYGFISTGSDLSNTDRKRCEQFLASRLSPLGVTLS